jgi:CxxH/CxxC protein (TIGR04129 family)
MKINCCQTHIDHALDMFVAEQNTFPILTELLDEEKLSTKCKYCDENAIYLVANE